MTKVYYDGSVTKDALQGKNCSNRIWLTRTCPRAKLKDSGYDVIIGIRPGHSYDKAKKMVSMCIL